MTASVTDIVKEVTRAGLSADHRSVLIVTDGSDTGRQCADIFRDDGLDNELAQTLPDALYLLRVTSGIDLVLVDGTGTQIDAREMTRKIKQDAANRFTPLMVVHRAHEGGLRIELLRTGADDCLAAPFEPTELLQRCRNLIQTKQATDALEDSDTVIYTLARIIEGRDKYTQGHVERVADYSAEIGKRMGLCDAELAILSKGGIVHDLGKIAVSDAVLNKPGRLDDDEMAVMRQHPVVGYDILVRLRTFHDVLHIVRWHHERPNGKGYPDGIGGGELTLLPRIAAVADCFDAVTTVRPYHNPRPVNEAVKLLRDCAQRDEYDKDVVAVLAEMAGESLFG